MFKLAIKLAIIAIIAHAGVKIVPVFWQYAQFKDRLGEIGRFYGGRKTVEDLRARALKAATVLEVPLEQPISIQRSETMTIIDTQYTGQLEYFPKQFYPWKFVIHLEEVPQRYDAYIP
jgi:hypothetical protein